MGAASSSAGVAGQLNKKTVRDADLAGKRLLVRVDFNVPLDPSGRITDDTRIRETLPTIEYCHKEQARIILLSHLGRPDGTRAPKYSLRPVAERLGDLLKRPVAFVDDCLGPTVEHAVQELQPGQVLVLENVRFYPEEEKNDPTFAQALARLGDIFVNDAFGAAHRAHASTEGIGHHLPGVAGLLIEKEITYLGRAITSPARPYAAILGGAKVSDKIGVLNNLMERVDRILIGGGMSYTFLKAQGKAVGSSRVEADKLDLARQILEKAAAKKIDVLLPLDHVITTSLDAGTPVKTVNVGDIPDGWMGADIGPETAKAFVAALRGAKTVVWNGPVGVFEQPRFLEGSRAVAQALADLKGATTIIGGGDSAACVQQLKLGAKMSHISTGGGASLEFLEGKTLPGIAVLQDK